MTTADPLPPTPRRRLSPPSAVRSVLWNWGTFVFGIAITFVLSPFVVRRLGNTNYGIWVLLASLVGYLGLLDFGVRGAVTRYVAKLHAEASDAEASRLASTALTIFSVMGAVAIVVTVLLATTIVHRFHITPAETSTARKVVILGGLSVAATLIGGAFGGVMIGLQRFDLSGKVEIGIGIIRAVGIYFALTADYGLLALAVIQFGASLARTVATAWYAFRLYPELRIRWGAWDREMLQQIFSFSFFSTLLLFSSSLILYSDSVVIGAFLPVAAITYFAIAGNLTDYARSVIRGISTTITPRTSALEAQDRAAITPLILRGSRLASLLILPMGVTFLIRGDAFIGLWMGKEYAGPSGEILRILTIALVFSAAVQVLVGAVFGLSLHKGLVPYGIGEALANLGLSIFLVQRIGLPGVAWGTTLPNLIMSLVILPWYGHRRMGIPLGAYFLQSWLRPSAAMVPFALGTALVARYWPGSNLVSYFSGVTAVLPLALAGAWFIALDRDERATLVGTLRERWDRLRHLGTEGAA
jgi:O-antigen/teichoic acid export membrane protein